MTAPLRLAASCAMALAGCTGLNPVQEGPADLVEASVEDLGENRFAVSLVSLNADGYELARCIAAGYAETLRDDDGDRIHHVFRREGGRLTDQFRVVEGVRTQRTSGVQSYAFDPGLTPADHDGRDVMAVDVQLARCDRAGLPTGAE